MSSARRLLRFSVRSLYLILLATPSVGQVSATIDDAYPYAACMAVASDLGECPTSPDTIVAGVGAGIAVFEHCSGEPELIHKMDLGGMVYDIALTDELILVAAHKAGLVVVDRQTYNKVVVAGTEGATVVDSTEWLNREVVVVGTAEGGPLGIPAGALHFVEVTTGAGITATLHKSIQFPTQVTAVAISQEINPAGASATVLTGHACGDFDQDNDSLRRLDVAFRYGLPAGFEVIEVASTALEITTKVDDQGSMTANEDAALFVRDILIDEGLRRAYVAAHEDGIYCLDVDPANAPGLEEVVGPLWPIDHFYDDTGEVKIRGAYLSLAFIPGGVEVGQGNQLAAALGPPYNVEIQHRTVEPYPCTFCAPRDDNLPIRQGVIVYQLDPTGDPKPEIAGELAEAVAEFTTPLCLPNLDAGTCAVDDDGKVFQLRCRDIAVRVDGTGDYFIDSASMGLGLQVFAASEDSIVPSCNGEAVPTSVYQSVSQLENAGGWDTVPYKTPLKTFDYALVLEHPAVGPETPTRALYVSTEDGLLTFDLNVSATPVQDQEPHWLGVQALLLAGFPNDANGHGGRIIALQHDSYNVLSLDGTPLQPTPVEDGCVIPLLETQRTIGLAVEDGGLGAGDERWLYTTVGGANGDLLAVWNLGTSAAPVTPVAPEATYTVSNGKRLGFIATRRVVGDEHVVYVSYSEENPGVCGAMMCGPGENAGGILTFEVARPAGTAAISLVDTDCTVCSSDEGFAPAASTTGCDPLGKPSVSSLQPTLDLSRERLYCGWTGAAMAMYDVSTPDDPLLLATRFFETPERPVEPTPIHAIPGYSDSGAQEDYVYIPLMHQGVGILNAYDDEMFASGPMPIMETPLQAFFAALDPFADPGERRALYVPIGRGGLVHMTLSF